MVGGLITIMNLLSLRQPMWRNSIGKKWTNCRRKRRSDGKRNDLDVEVRDATRMVFAWSIVYFYGYVALFVRSVVFFHGYIVFIALNAVYFQDYIVFFHSCVVCFLKSQFCVQVSNTIPIIKFVGV